MRGALTLVCCVLLAGIGGWANSTLAKPAKASECVAGTLYLTFDTGNMRHAEWIADLLASQGIRATFFLSNEPTHRGDLALDPSWDGYWRKLVAAGHAFGSHTLRHGRVLSDKDERRVVYRPQFGDGAGRSETLSPESFCQELKAVEGLFLRATGQSLSPWWRAPGGRTTRNALSAARACGFAHVFWSPAGFLGDELPSEKYPNDRLLANALHHLRDGDIVIAHLGIWSRKDPFAPMLRPLIEGLKREGFCFATLNDHPSAQRAGPGKDIP